MTQNKQCFLALDVGTRRIGVARADSQTRVPAPITALDVDGLELDRLRELVTEQEISVVVVGLPRNQAGEETAQSISVRNFVQEKVSALGIPIVFQDESVTSVMAEDYLKKSKKSYTKADIDMYAAAIILGDYLEENYGR